MSWAQLELLLERAHEARRYAALCAGVVASEVYNVLRAFASGSMEPRSPSHYDPGPLRPESSHEELYTEEEQNQMFVDAMMGFRNVQDKRPN